MESVLSMTSMAVLLLCIHGTTDVATASARIYPINGREPPLEDPWFSGTQEPHEKPVPMWAVNERPIEAEAHDKMRQKRSMLCGAPPRIKNGVVLESWPYSYRPDFRCHPGFSLLPGTLKCVRGRWSGRLPRCLPSRAGFRHFLCRRKVCAQECEMRMGRPECTCYPGYHLHNDLRNCNDIDECAWTNFGCSHYCVNTLGSAHCACPDGYALEADNKTCSDVDECKVHNFQCSHDCVNTQGSAYCVCPEGLELTADDKTCADVDECKSRNFQCSHDCVNTEGSAYCACPAGFELTTDDKTCADVNECDTTNFQCSHECVNTEGSAFCACPDGFELTTNNKTCTDVDECDTTNFECSHECINTKGSAYCACPEGFELTADNKTCTDVNECDTTNFQCSHECVNTEGSAFCACPDGFELTADNKTCIDVDECDTSNFQCSHECVNTEGSAFCACPDGFELTANNKTCTDVDECDTTNFQCSHECVNTEGSAFCACPDGFELTADNKTCTEITCPIPAGVSNGGIDCGKGSQDVVKSGTTCTITCNVGHTLRGDNTTQCFNNGTWSNALPRCESEHHCAPLKKLKNGQVWPKRCVHISKNPEGSKCFFTCNPGYDLDGKIMNTCIKKNGSLGWKHEPATCRKETTCPALPTISNGRIFCDTASRDVVTAGTTCTVTCKPRYLLRGHNETQCLRDGTWSNDLPTCQSKPHCAATREPANGKVWPKRCLAVTANTVGSTCYFICNPGYDIDGRIINTCTDRNGSLEWKHKPPTCKKAPHP